MSDEPENDSAMVRGLRRRGWTIVVVVAVASLALTLWWWFEADDLARRERLSECADEIEAMRAGRLAPASATACRQLRGTVIDAECFDATGGDGPPIRREVVFSRCTSAYCATLDPRPALCDLDEPPRDEDPWLDFWRSVLRHELDYPADTVTNDIETVAAFLTGLQLDVIEVTMPVAP